MAKKSKKKAAKKSSKKAVKKVAKKAAKKPVKKVAKKAVKKAAKKAAAKRPAAPALPKTNTVNPYINFNGNCEEAFNLYKSVFGGQFGMVSKFKDMPPMEGQPPLMQHDADKIMHISLQISRETTLMGSDVIEGGPTIVFGTNFSISVNAISKAEADHIYNGLSAGGHVTMPMSHTFWGSYFGMCTDRFGISWMVSAEPDKK
jgi:PhnB protein